MDIVQEPEIGPRIIKTQIGRLRRIDLQPKAGGCTRGVVRYVGNAAALGAQLCLLSESERALAERVATRIEHISLATHPDFEEVFVDAMNFPRPA